MSARAQAGAVAGDERPFCKRHCRVSLGVTALAVLDLLYRTWLASKSGTVTMEKPRPQNLARVSRHYLRNSHAKASSQKKSQRTPSQCKLLIKLVPRGKSPRASCFLGKSALDAIALGQLKTCVQGLDRSTSLQEMPSVIV